jgi:RNA polymerase sigma-70 factor, ECF subfamily
VDNEITRLLGEWRGGDAAAGDQLAPLVYPELRRLARYHLRVRGREALSTTELVHEAFLRLLGGSTPALESRSHFYSIAARIMRQVLTDWARRSLSAKRGSGQKAVSLDAVPASSNDPIFGDLVALDDALEALSVMDERKAIIVEMRYFGGMTAAEIGDALQIAPVTVQRQLRAATAWLRSRMSPPAP